MRRRELIFGAGLAALLAACQREPEKTETPPAGDSGEGRAMTDPSQVVRQLYDPYLTEGATFPELREAAPWSASLGALLEAMTARSRAIGEPILDFDPIIGAQDYQLADLNVVNEAVAENSHAVVRASFTNIGAREEIVYDLVWEGDRWRVDNIRGDGWDLRQVAAAPTSP